jgi:hypothetical protein
MIRAIRGQVFGKRAIHSFKLGEIPFDLGFVTHKNVANLYTNIVKALY